MRRKTGAVLAAALALALPLGAGVWLLTDQRAQTALVGGDFGKGDYQMMTTLGASFTQASLTGAPSLVFFGFTHCPDVCPTTLGDIALWQDELGPDAERLRVFMISVDPSRDTADVLGDYVGWLPGAIGVTGSEAESQKTQRAFRVFSRKVPMDNGDYTMDHSSSVLVFDDRGEFVTNIPYQSPPEVALERIRQAL